MTQNSDSPQPASVDGSRSTLCSLAVSPFRALPPGPLDRRPTRVADASGDIVLVCFDDDDGPDLIAHCDRKYSEAKIDADPSFICPCGRLGQRMTECSPARVGL